MTLFRSPRAYCLLLGSLVMLLGLSCVVALGFGPARLDSGLVGRIVLQRLFGVAAEPGAWSAGQEHIVWLIRAPRVLLGACVGAGLALVGAALQAVTRNPLADPHLLGATSGATLGAVLVVLYIGEVIGLLTLPLAAFLGALGSMLLVLGLLASVPDSAHSALRWLQALGGLYFLWLAGQALLAQRRLEMPAQRDVPSRGGYLRGLRDGLLASSLNPKLPIFYAGLFGVLARFSLPGWALALCLAWMSLAVLCWDMALVRLLDRPRWRGWLQRRVGALDRLCGVLLLALGGWLVLAAL